MAYEKIGFKKGDVLKAEHLNHIEEGLTTSQAHSLGITFQSNNTCYLTDLGHYQTREEVLALLNRPNTTLFNYDMQGCLYRENEGLIWSGILLSLTGESFFISVNFSPLSHENQHWQGTISTYASIQNHKINLDSVISDRDYFYLTYSPQICILQSEAFGSMRIASSNPMGNILLLSGYGSFFLESGIPVSFKIFGGINEERNFTPLITSIDPMYATLETITGSITAVQEHLSVGFPIYAIIEPGLIQGFTGSVPVQQDSNGNLFAKIETITDNTYMSIIMRFIDGSVQSYLLQQKQLSPL